MQPTASKQSVQPINTIESTHISTSKVDHRWGMILQNTKYINEIQAPRSVRHIFAILTEIGWVALETPK